MFHTDDEFLREIERQPAERTVRLVYADWLDERDDVRGELIRIEEETRQLPVYSDRFWELKPRRNELRAKVGAEWCGRMRYGTECEPVFRHGIPDGWRERWRLIREFTERWHGVPLGDIGGRQKEIAETEARLGRKLPPSVREWLAFVHDVLQSSDSSFLRDGFGGLGEVPGHPALSLLEQAEGDLHWAVLNEDFGLADPPVRGYFLDYDRPGREFVLSGQNPLNDSVPAFVFDYLWEYLFPRGGSIRAGVENGGTLIYDLTAALPVHTEWYETNLFEAENICVRVGPFMWDESTVLRAIVFRELPREQVPKCLFEHPRQQFGVVVSGIFV